MEKTYRGSRLFGRIGWLDSNYSSLSITDKWTEVFIETK